MKKCFLPISILVFILAISSCSTDQEEQSAKKAETKTKTETKWHFQVYLNADASEEEMREVEQSIDDYVKKQVDAKYDYRDKQEAFADWQEALVDDPEMLSEVTLENTPADFLIIIYSDKKPDIKNLVNDLYELSGVEKISEITKAPKASDKPAPGTNFKVEIFMEVKATDLQINVVNEMLMNDKSSGLISKTTYINKWDATRIFNELDLPYTYYQEADDLPVSFLITTPTGDAATADMVKKNTGMLMVLLNLQKSIRNTKNISIKKSS